MCPVELQLFTGRVALRPLSINDVGLVIDMFVRRQNLVDLKLPELRET